MAYQSDASVRSRWGGGFARCGTIFPLDTDNRNA
jgi:hypothetical protein